MEYETKTIVMKTSPRWLYFQGFLIGLTIGLGFAALVAAHYGV